jgi:hypothetical protein
VVVGHRLRIGSGTAGVSVAVVDFASWRFG